MIMNQHIRLPGLKPGVCLRPELRPRGSGLIRSSAFNPELKIGVWRRRTYPLKEMIRRMVNESDSG